MTQPIQNFQEEIYKAGLGSPSVIADGLIHRFHIDGDKVGTKNGWYVFFIDGRSAGGAFGSWKTGETHTWKSTGDKPLSSHDRDKLNCKIRQAKAQRQREQVALNEQTAIKAVKIWSQTLPVISHRYLQHKRVLPLGIRQHNGALVIPVADIHEKLWSLQFIDTDGRKRFLKGGKVTGNFYQIGGIKDKLYVCEGLATGCTLNQKLNVPVLVAFNAGNLKPVAMAIRKKYPNITITIAADNDVGTEGNPGINKGREAASSVGGRMIYPNFDDVDGIGSDFNDYVNVGGAL